MASKSPTLAFEPTPALPDSDKENNSPTETRSARISDHVGRGRATKEVHFSPVLSPQRRAQSLATTVPLLEPISSASALPRQSQRSKNITPQVGMDGYIEQSRSLLDSQRQNFEHERRAFEAERKLWDAERRLLLSKIADLELKNKKTGGKRRYSNEAPSGSMQSFRSDFSLASNFSISRESPLNTGPPPVWETPDMGPAVTRVFSNETNNMRKADVHLPSISETGTPPSMDGGLSPSARPIDSNVSNVSISIEKLDPRLDGIILKSTALPPSLVGKVITPDSSTPQTPSPHSRTPNGTLHVSMNALLGSTPPNLITNAGHTPLAFDGPRRASHEQSDISTPTETGPRAPRSSMRPPHERSGSYFSIGDIKVDEADIKDQAAEPPATISDDEDPELQGPLSMASHPGNEQENAFLSELDARLLMEAKRMLGSPSESSDAGQRHGAEKPKQEELTVGDDEGPRLRLKKSSNFGSAFGASGRVMR